MPPSPTTLRALCAPLPTPYASGQSPDSTCPDIRPGVDWDIEVDGDWPEACELGCGGPLGGCVGSAEGVGGGADGGVDGPPDCPGAGPPEPPPGGRVCPSCPRASVGTGPDGSTGWAGAPRAGVFAVASAEGSAAAARSPAGRGAPPRTLRPGPAPRPSVVSPPGCGTASLSSPCCAALPGGRGGSGSLTLMQPASDAASAETVTAAATRRAGGRPAGGEGGDGAAADEGDASSGGTGND